MKKQLLTALVVSGLTSFAFAAESPSTTQTTTNGSERESSGAIKTEPMNREGMSMDEHSQYNADNRANPMRNQTTALSDANLQRSIHDQIMSDETLSVGARGVTVTSDNGKVTLKGSVASNQERMKLEEIAKKVKGAKSVDNQTEVQSF